MNLFKLLVLGIIMCLSMAVSAQDQCVAIGWATFDGQTKTGVPTGGGSATPIQVTTFSALKTAAESSDAKVIYVMNDMGNGYTGKSGDVIFVKSNKTIIGFKPGLTVKCSWQIKKVSNVVVRNLIIRGPGNSNSNQNWDCVNIEGSTRVWFDHCTVMEGEDGNFDVVKGSDNVSVTWCKFTYVTGGAHNLSNLIGSSDSESVSHGKLNVTYAYCWWDNVNSRCPRTRYGNIHVLNSYYNKVGSGAYAGFMSNLRVEGCYFESNVSNPTGLISTGGKAGVFAIDCNRGSTLRDGYNTAFTPPYDYVKFDVNIVKSMVTNATCGAGPTMLSPEICTCGDNITDPTLELTSGLDNQTVITGFKIQDIEYTWGGTATDVTVSGLPSGVTAIKSANTKTVIISGTPTASGTYSIKTSQTKGSTITVTGSITVTNPPSVQIISPVDGIQTQSPATITLTANASDSDGTVQKIEFFNGNTLIGTATSAPYSYTWTNVSSGNYIISAVATDNAGATATDEVAILVERGVTVPISIQAETACVVETGNPNESKNLGFNGTGYINLDNNQESEFRINVLSTESKSVEMAIRIASISQRNMLVMVNGIVQVAELELPSSGDWTKWITVNTVVSLVDGINSITFKSLTAEGGPNVDELTFFSGAVFTTDDCTEIVIDQQTPLVSLTMGESTQTIATGNAIIPVVYTWSGAATDVSVVGLPSGATATKDASAKTVTISGAPDQTFTFTISTVGGSSVASKTGTITVTPATGRQLYAGWNLIGCPLDGSTAIETALSSIWHYVDSVKDADGFNIPTYPTILNSLSNLEWGQGYYIKVSQDCTLSW